nr:tigger transposable element-derived protein 6-like [Rhipicephalus microplus]
MACAKRQNLPFATKLEIINRVKRGEKKSDFVAAYKIPRSTLSTILKNKADIKAKSDKRPGARGARRRRAAVYEVVEAAVYKWFVDVRSRNIPVSGPMIEQKAKDLAFLLGRSDFQGGSGWLQGFKERHDIVNKAVTGESKAADLDSVQKWLEENWRDIAARYRAQDIFNADETALFWQMLPNKTLACRSDKTSGGTKASRHPPSRQGIHLAGEDNHGILVTIKPPPRLLASSWHGLVLGFELNTAPQMTSSIGSVSEPSGYEPELLHFHHSCFTAGLLKGMNRRCLCATSVQASQR